jgi:LacI family transcriptional regulator
VLHLEWSLTEAIPASVRRAGVDGILARIETPRLVDTIAELGAPAVDLMGTYRPRGGGILDTDPRECARLAAEHFLSRGFRNLAFCGYPGIHFSDQRSHFFREHVAQHGYRVAVFGREEGNHRNDGIIMRERCGEFAEHELADWLSILLKPVAVFACNDVRGRQVLAACDHANLRVPDDVAVLGVDNDPVVCELAVPPLSSIEPNPERLGYEAAAMLDRLMAGEPAPEEAVLIPPRKLHARLSSDVLAVEDRDVAAALRYVRDHACEGISVGSIARRLAMSRTTLDRHFHRNLGRSVKAEIDRLRVERAKQLLDDTEYKVSTIAEMTGYGVSPHFITAFKRLTGMTPGEYRERVKVQ